VIRLGDRRAPPRAVTAASLAALVTGAVAALAFASDGVAAPVVLVERLSSTLTDLVRRTGSGLGFGYAFAAGAVAAFNPCGFALLPAYLGLYVGEADRGRSSRFARSIVVSGVVTSAFMLVFGVVGGALALGASAVVRLIPWLAVAIAVALVVIGSMLVVGWRPAWSVGAGIAGALGGAAGRGGVAAYGAFGVGYGLASLSCTLPVLVAVTGGSLAAGSSIRAAGQLLLFAAGTASVLAALTIAVGALGRAPLIRARRFTRVFPFLGGILLVLAGAYLLFYWLTVGRPLLL
jgi:cytochrome c biogenesis protein CcdA